jgi:hypothetical protein
LITIPDGSYQEALEIGVYIDKAIRVRQETGAGIHQDQLPIFGITKNSLLAFRYVTPASQVCRLSSKFEPSIHKLQVRRLQLRLRTPEDCQLVLGILTRRGLEVQPERPRTGRPDTASSEMRPLTVQGTSSYFHRGRTESRPNAFNLPSVEAGSLSHTRLPEPPQPLEVATVVGRLPIAEMQGLSREAPARDSYSIPHQAHPFRLSTAPASPLWREPLGANQPNHEAQPISHELSPVREVGFNQIENTPLLHRGSSPTYADSAAVLDSQTDRSSLPKDAIMSTSPRRPVPTKFPVFPETLEHEIPPRRELPFKRPESHRSRSERGSSRPSSSALDLTPLRKPTMRDSNATMLSKNNEEHSAFRQPWTRPQTASSSSKSSWTLADGIPSRPSGAAEAVENFNKIHAEPASKLRKTLSPIEELLAQARSPDQRPSTSRIPRVNSLLDAPHEVVSPPSTVQVISIPPATTSSPQPNERNEGTSEPVALPAAPIVPTPDAEVSSLNLYAAQSHADRAAALDDFMASKLEDPSFTILCRDVENCWRRIALGL